MRCFGPFARNDVANGGQDAAEFWIVGANDIEVAKLPKQPFPHASTDFVGLENDVQKRTTLHRECAGSGSQRAKVKKPEFTLVAGTAIVDGRAVLMPWHREPCLGGKIIILGIVCSFEADSDCGFYPWLTEVCALTGPEESAVGLLPEFEIVADFRAVLLIKARDDNFNDNVLLRYAFYRQIIAALKVVLIDGLPPRQSVCADRELYCLEYC